MSYDITLNDPVSKETIRNGRYNEMTHKKTAYRRIPRTEASRRYNSKESVFILPGDFSPEDMDTFGIEMVKEDYTFSQYIDKFMQYYGLECFPMFYIKV